ncbi:MAG TPA: DNA-3-methyladenine glycosylase I [Caulobacteraceae bacterium]|nr:DNA-3-methyladenine glycosylase I [Caulobacteraceae bacterium]
MRSFQAIYDAAAERKGTDLERLIGEHAPKSAAELAAIPDHLWLAQMSKVVFQAGFNWRVIDNKWPGFETSFHRFDPPLNAAMSEEEFDAHLKDAGIVRNAAKIASVRDNACFLVDLAAEHGSAAAFFAAWPDADFAGLLEVMKTRAARLSGETAMRFFRFMGKASFITTRDVTAALITAEVIEKPPKSRRDLQAVQAAFNAWSAESGRDLTAISRVLALSTGPEGWGR